MLDYIFSEEFKNRTAKSGHLDLDEAVISRDFYKELMSYMGVEPEKIDELLKEYFEKKEE